MLGANTPYVSLRPCPQAPELDRSLTQQLVYTSILCIPKGDAVVTPDVSFVNGLAAVLAIDTVQIFAGYDTPDYWDEGEREVLAESEGAMVYIDGDDPTFFEQNVPFGEAIERWHSQQPLRTHFMFPFGRWAKGLAQALETLVPPETAGGGYVAWDVSLTIGPWSICKYDEAETLAEGELKLSISGDGCPRDLDAYLRAFEGTEYAAELLSWLQTQTGSQWRWLISLS